MHLNQRKGFAGTYPAEDCWFLLTLVSANGQEEKPPSRLLKNLYEGGLHYYQFRIAQQVMHVAKRISRSSNEEIVLASLLRAGTPFGILLKRALKLFGREAVHYSIASTKKDGVDPAALSYISTSHPNCSFWLVDGWTGKGGLSKGVEKSIIAYNNGHRSQHLYLPSKLVVLADLAGTALIAASTKDYLMPSACIHAPMCGLVSKPAFYKEGEFYSAAILDYLAACDCSMSFVNTITDLMPYLLVEQGFRGPEIATTMAQMKASHKTALTLSRLSNQYRVDPELIKHGLSETVRAVQRRPMRLFLLQDPHDERNDQIKMLAHSLKISVRADKHLPYECVGICQS